MSADTEEDRSYNWRVTMRPGGNVGLDIGDELSGLSEQVGSTAVTHAIAEGLIKIGTRLLQSQVDDDDDEGDW